MTDTNINQTTQSDETTLFSVDANGSETVQATKNEKLVLVKHDFQIWSGCASLISSDLNLEEGKDMAKENVVAAQGLKWLIDRNHLKGMKAAKRAFLLVLQNHGVRFMGGYGVPADQWPAIRADLDKALMQFSSARQDFLSNYNRYVEEWCQNHPLLSASIRAAAPTDADIDRRIKSGYLGCKLMPTSPSDAQALDDEISGLTGQLAKDVQQAAESFVRTSIVPGSNQDIRSLKTLQQIAKKLRGLCFVAPGCQPLSQFLENFLAGLCNDKGKIERRNEEAMLTLTVLCSVLSNSSLMESVIKGELSVELLRKRLERNIQILQSVKEEEKLAQSLAAMPEAAVPAQAPETAPAVKAPDAPKASVIAEPQPVIVEEETKDSDPAVVATETPDLFEPQKKASESDFGSIEDFFDQYEEAQTRVQEVKAMEEKVEKPVNEDIFKATEKSEAVEEIATWF